MRGKRVNLFIGVLLAFILLLGLYNCGGGSSSSSTDSSSTVKGLFSDSPVTGLEYKTGTVSGITENGFFECKKGDNVTFYLGNVTFGTTECKSIVTPVDLSDNQTAIENMLIFLQSLDNDSDPDNGITITKDVRQKAENWSLDFSSKDFKKQIPDNITLIDNGTAINRFKKSLYCLYSGVYEGKYSDGNSKQDIPLYFLVSPRKAFSLIFEKRISPISSGGLSSEGVPVFVFDGEDDDSGLELQDLLWLSLDEHNKPSLIGGEKDFKFINFDTILATFVGEEDNVTISAKKIDFKYELNAIYRFTGMVSFGEGEYSPIVVDILPDNKIVAFVYDNSEDSDNGRKLYKLQGVLSSDGSFDIVGEDGEELKGIFDANQIGIAGKWLKNKEEKGLFVGYGCAINIGLKKQQHNDYSGGDHLTDIETEQQVKDVLGGIKEANLQFFKGIGYSAILFDLLDVEDTEDVDGEPRSARSISLLYNNGNYKSMISDIHKIIGFSLNNVLSRSRIEEEYSSAGEPIEEECSLSGSYVVTENIDLLGYIGYKAVFNNCCIDSRRCINGSEELEGIYYGDGFSVRIKADNLTITKETARQKDNSTIAIRMDNITTFLSMGEKGIYALMNGKVYSSLDNSSTETEFKNFEIKPDKSSIKEGMVGWFILNGEIKEFMINDSKSITMKYTNFPSFAFNSNGAREGLLSLDYSPDDFCNGADGNYKVKIDKQEISINGDVIINSKPEGKEIIVIVNLDGKTIFNGNNIDDFINKECSIEKENIFEDFEFPDELGFTPLLISTGGADDIEIVGSPE